MKEAKFNKGNRFLVLLNSVLNSMVYVNVESILKVHSGLFLETECKSSLRIPASKISGGSSWGLRRLKSMCGSEGAT